MFTRVIVPDSHGAHIDSKAAAAFLKDLKRLDPKEIVLLGDHLDCAGAFSTHSMSYTKEIPESYTSDVKATNKFLDQIQKLAPKAQYHYLEGNHEHRVERTATNMFRHKSDADGFLDAFGPEKVLELKKRGIKYYRRHEMYHGLASPGIIKLGKCHFMHGFSAAKHADAVHLARVGDNIVFGHIHRALSTVSRTVTREGYGAWCPGTLSKLHLLYSHTEPSTWSHGYAVQFVNPSGRFLHINVPIIKGESLLHV